MKLSKREFVKLLGGGTAAMRAVAGGNVGALHQPELPVRMKSEALIEEPQEEKTTQWYEVAESRRYDSLRLDANIPARFGLFQESVVTKGWRRTNMHMAGGLPMPCSMFVKKIHFALKDATEGFKKALDDYQWRLYLGNKQYAHGPCAIDLRNPELCADTLTFGRTKGLWIPPGLSFYMDFSSDHSHYLDVKDHGELWVILEGVEGRAIQ